MSDFYNLVCLSPGDVRSVSFSGKVSLMLQWWAITASSNSSPSGTAKASNGTIARSGHSPLPLTICLCP